MTLRTPGARRSCGLRSYLVYVCVLLHGCSYGYGIGAGPVVSTEGQVGGQFWVSGYIGDRGVRPSAGAVVSAVAIPRLAFASGGIALGLSSQNDMNDMVYRLHALMHFGVNTSGEVFLYPTLAGAVSPPRMRRFHLSLEARAGLALSSERLGLFTLGLVYERWDYHRVRIFPI